MSTRTDSPGRKWPLGIRLEVLPGDSVVEKFSRARDYGFDAVELPGRYLEDYLADLLRVRDSLPLPVSSISLGFRGSLVSADSRARKQCREDIVDLLGLCSDLGAVGLVMPPVLHMDGHDRLRKPLPGYVTVAAAEDSLLIEQLPELASRSEELGVLLMLEPVNHYETDYMFNLAWARSICERVQAPGLGLVADLYHMQMEELSPPDALKASEKWLRHVHVAENTRVEPGRGSLDIRSSLVALSEIGYAGHVVVECRSLSGPADKVLPASVGYLTSLMSGL